MKMFVEKDKRSIHGILNDPDDNRECMWLARRANEFPNGLIRSVLCRNYQIERMENLKQLSLYGNDLKSIAGIGSLGCLPNLEYLDIGNNKLSDISEDLAKLSSLKELHAEDNCISKIEEGILGLSNLRLLRLSNNRIEVLPSSIGRLGNLEKLLLEGNKLSNLPQEIVSLRKLNYLNLRGNNISSVTEALGDMPELQTLILSSNELEYFPETKNSGKYPKLVSLRLNGNKIGNKS